MKNSMTAPLIGGIFIGAIPIVQILIYRIFWIPDIRPVDKETCECSCFDAVFKGIYEMNAKTHRYKHVYFNATWQTTCIWTMTVAFLLLGYEAVKTLTSLCAARALRPIMAIVFCLSVYPHIYGWFALFNYYNDDFYPMFNHQVYFSITELISSYVVLRLCDRDKGRELWMYSLVVGTALVHILIAGPEEFLKNLFIGRAHQLWRNLGLASTDIVSVVLPIIDYHRQRDGKMLIPTADLNHNSTKRFQWQGMSTRVKAVLIYCVVIFVIGSVMSNT